MRANPIHYRLCLLLGVVVTALAAGCSSDPAAPTATTAAISRAAVPSGSWPYPNGDLANTRVAPASVITSANVSSLREAWSFKLTGTPAAGVKDTGSLVAGPVVADGVAYIQDLDCNVYAVSLATGKLKWEYQVNTPEVSGPGPNGVAVSGGVVYGDTPYTVFALHAATGKVLWSDPGLLNSGQGSFEIQPQVAGGRVYLASAYGSGPGGGVLLALDAASGRLLWRFDTVTGADAGVKAVGAGSGGAWEPPLVGPDGSVTFGTGNPYQSIGSAISYPSRQLYTDSLVNLNVVTGRLRWYYQAVPDDFMDHDLQASPVSAVVRGVPAVVGAGKLGYVGATNAKTGALLWKTPVGVHNGTDADSALALSHAFKPTFPYTYEPGAYGGVLSDIAVAGGSVYVATIDLPFSLTSLSSVDGTPKAPATLPGEVEALNLATGKVEWDTKVSSLPLGAVTVSRDLVFTTLYSGTLMALDRSTGSVVYSHQLPASTNAPIAVFGNTVLVPAGAPPLSAKVGSGGTPQLVAYTVR
jgi:alcohol dehydrogenase (cytochrome c)